MKNDLNGHISRSSIALLTLVRSLGFGLLGLMTLIALGLEIFNIFSRGTIGLGDLLLLFIYLQVLSMVRVHLMTGEIPLNMPFTIAMLALTRYLLLDATTMPGWQALATGGAMLLLAISLLILRYWRHTETTIPKKSKVYK